MLTTDTIANTLAPRNARAHISPPMGLQDVASVILAYNATSRDTAWGYERDLLIEETHAVEEQCDGPLPPWLVESVVF